MCIVMIRTFTIRNIQLFTEIKPFPSIKHVCNSPVWFRDFCYEAPFPVWEKYDSPAFFEQTEAYSLLIMLTRKEKKVLMNQTNQSR